MALIKWKAEANLIVKDTNGKTMKRKVEVFAELDDTVIGMNDAAGQKAAMTELLGLSILQYTATGLEVPSLTYMGVTDVYISALIPEADLVAYITGYDDPNVPVSVLPPEFEVSYPMYRRAKYNASNPAVGSKVVYFKTPENVYRGDPIENSELPAAFPILNVFQNLMNGGVNGGSKLYVDPKFNWELEDIILSDHIQAPSGKVA